MGLKAVIKKKTNHFSIDVEFACPEGKTLALIGPSGSGKSTIIRMLAGLEKPDEGNITHQDQTFFLSQNKFSLSPQKREIGYVFQDYTLFPHLTVRGNVAFAAKDKDEVEYLINYFGLTSLQDRKPHQISGGERQRCAICQALARRPRLMLLDEPFSALDVVTRRSLRAELKRIKAERTFTMIYVTHDINEALFIADTILPVVNGAVDKDWLERIISPLSYYGAEPRATRGPKLALAY